MVFFTVFHGVSVAIIESTANLARSMHLYEESNLSNHSLMEK